MSALYDRIQSTTDFLRQRTGLRPVAGIILGSGLGELSQRLEVECAVPYEEIPGFPRATVAGHSGKWLFGQLAGRPVVMLAGRFHYYEGYDMQEVTLPVRVMHALGARTLLVSNAAGGMNSDYRIGDIVCIRDHINLFPEHPLRGANDERLGPRFPDMSEPYCRSLLARAREVSLSLGIACHEGVYAGIQGPTFETAAEYGWLRRIGADLVGMSTVPEVIVAIHAGMKVFGASIVTDLGVEGVLEKVSHDHVLAAAAGAAPRLSALFESLTATL